MLWEYNCLLDNNSRAGKGNFGKLLYLFHHTLFLPDKVYNPNKMSISYSDYKFLLDMR